MDRAEAIKYIEGAKYGAECAIKIVNSRLLERHGMKQTEAYNMAIAALREQEQREQGCEYCDGTEKELYYQDGACSQMNDWVYISGNRIECDFGCKAWGAFYINFCPMCGRKLTKEGADHEEIIGF